MLYFNQKYITWFTSTNLPQKVIYIYSLFMIYILTIQKQQPDTECDQFHTFLSLTALFPYSAGYAPLWDSF